MIMQTEKEEKFCEYWLSNYTRLSQNLSRAIFNESTIKKLVHYELATRRRLPILNRLTGRYYKLKRTESYDAIKRIVLEVGGERKNYRGVFSEESKEYWREGI